MDCKVDKKCMTNLKVTRFFTRVPRSEWPRYICRGFCFSDPLKLPEVGELGSDNCLSTNIGFRTPIVLEVVAAIDDSGTLP